MIIIKNLLTHLVPEKKSWKVQLLSEWHAIVGHLKTPITLEKIYDDTLILGVNNSSWMQELYILSPLLLSMINARIHQSPIKIVRFKLINNKPIKLIQSPKLKKKEQFEITINPKEKQALARINDEALRKALHEFLMRCYRERI